ncbi:LuxR C-terminal-related transcriptional regulator [Kitasatospora sp. NE20-6]|uniref:LuxR C-terminal-related transcriptional regulator n=1 Tax=Kitasatospora sp. NE20-6 TaxID=2859066 RepID=UPI0038B2F101
MPHLTRTDTALLTLVAVNATNKQISLDTGLSAHTVPDAVRQMLQRTGTVNRVHAAAWAAARGLAGTPQPIPDMPRATRFSEILSGWASGRTNEELATEMGISVGTVRGYGKEVLRCLGVRSQVRAAVVGVLGGLVRLDRIDPSWLPVPLYAPAAPARRSR